MANLLEYFIGQESREGRSTLGATTRAESPLLAARRHQKLIATICASDASKATLETATVKIGVNDTVDKGSPEAIALLEALLPDALHRVVACLDEPVQGRLVWLAGTIEANGTFCDQGELLPCRSVEGSFQNLSNPGESQDGSTHERTWTYGVTEDGVPSIPLRNKALNAVKDLRTRGYTVFRTPGWQSRGIHYTYTNALIFNHMVFVPVYGRVVNCISLAHPLCGMAVNSGVVRRLGKNCNIEIVNPKKRTLWHQMAREYFCQDSLSAFKPILYP